MSILGDWPAITRKPPRELSLLFGRVSGHRSLDDAVLSGQADVVRLSCDQIEGVLRAAASAGQAAEALRRFSAKPLLGAISFIDEVQDIHAGINLALGVDRTELVRAARLLADKEAFYRALEQRGIAMPWRVRVPNLDALEPALRELQHPLDACIVKPVTGTESRGVYRPAPGVDPADIAATVAALPDLRADEPLLLMEYLPRKGPLREYCVDGFSCDGTIGFHAIHEKVRIFEDYPIHDRQMVTPPREGPSPRAVRAILDVLPGILALGDFVFHLELREDNAGHPVPIDMSLRPGGGLLHRSVLASSGVDLRFAHSLCCLGGADELRSLHPDPGARRRHVAIGAYFSNGHTHDRLKSDVARLQVSGADSGLVACDISSVSILRARSRRQKPDVGLCVQSSASGDEALARIDDIATQLGATIAPAGVDVAGNRLVALEFDGFLHLPALQEALQETLALHGVLQGRDPRPSPVHARTVVTTPDKLAGVIAEQAAYAFDADGGPLLRATVLEVEGRRANGVLVLCLHHSVAASWAETTLVRDLGRAYRAQRLDPLRRPGMARRLAPVADRVVAPTAVAEPLPGLAPDHVRSGGGGQFCDRVRFELGQPLRQALQALAETTRVTLAEVFWAAWVCLLHRHGGLSSVGAWVELPGAGSGHRSVIVNVPPGGTWRQLLAVASEALRDASVHVAGGNRPPPPLGFTVSFTERKHDFGTLGVRMLDVPAVTSAHELELRWDVDEVVRATLAFRVKLFDRARIERLARHLEGLLGAIVTEPDASVSSLRFMSDGELEQLLELGRASSDDAPRPGLPVHLQIAAQARRTPAAVAVSCNDGEDIRYGDLERQANRVAQCLLRGGIATGEVVGLYLRPSVSLVVALLAILKAGAAYLPIDSNTPAERVRQMLTDASAKGLVTESGLDQVQPSLLPVGCTLQLDRDRTQIDAAPDDAPFVDMALDDLAYVICTSGSTGRPKGVMVTHRGVTNLCAWYAGRVALGPLTRNLVASSLGFDLTQKNITATLCQGGRVVIARSGALSGRDMQAMIEQHEVTLVNCAPSQMMFAFEYPTGRARASTLRDLVFGGEAITAETINRMRRVCPGVRIINSYGPTEISDVCTEVEVGIFDEPKFTVIGKAIGHTRLMVLDEQLELVPIGVPGELYIGGVGVGRGYAGAPALTAERFLPDPFSGHHGARMYRSGDVVRWRTDGHLDFLGRRDHQVKVHGVRIELGELENRLMCFRGVVQAVVVCDDTTGGEARLIAFVSAAPGVALDISQLRRHMQAGLPAYMVPSSILQLASMPLTASGKVDRLRLPKATPGGGALRRPIVAPRGSVEARLVELWIDVTGATDVDPTDNFFELGGSSLSVSRLVARVRSAFHVDLQMGDVFDRPCFDDLSQHVARLMTAGSATAAQRPIVSRKARDAVLKRLSGMSDDQVDALLREMRQKAGH